MWVRRGCQASPREGLTSGESPGNFRLSLGNFQGTSGLTRRGTSGEVAGELLWKSGGFPATCQICLQEKSSRHRPHPAGQKGVYRPVSQEFPVVYERKIDSKGWDTGRVSHWQGHPASRYVLMCLFCSLKRSRYGGALKRRACLNSKPFLWEPMVCGCFSSCP